jgi:hypothetical protein
MADGKYYPDYWKDYVKCLKATGQTPSRKWAIFAARYRAASAYQMATFMQLTDKLTAGYSAGVGLLLSYSAFEAACRASMRETYEVEISSSNGFAVDCRKELIRWFGRYGEEDFPLRSALASSELRKKLDAFFVNDTDNLLPIASAFRHLFAHGHWTPYGSDTLSNGACSAIEMLAQLLRIKGDDLLSAALLKTNETLVGSSSNTFAK